MKSLSVELSNNIAHFLNLTMMTPSGSRIFSFRKHKFDTAGWPSFFLALIFFQHQFSQHHRNIKLVYRRDVKQNLGNPCPLLRLHPRNPGEWFSWPYMGYIGMCGPKGYSFSLFWS